MLAADYPTTLWQSWFANDPVLEALFLSNTNRVLHTPQSLTCSIQTFQDQSTVSSHLYPTVFAEQL